MFGSVGIFYKDFVLSFAYIWLKALFRVDVYINPVAKYLNMLIVLSKFGLGFFWDNNYPIYSFYW